MSAAKIEKLVRMANQIGDFFAPMPGSAGVEGAADHLRKFWTPKMISEIIAYLNAGHAGLNVTAAGAVKSLKQDARTVL